MEVVYNKHISTRQIPKNLKREDLGLFAHEFSATINETTLLKIDDVYILKDTIFSLKKLKFYLSYSHVHGLAAKSVLKRFLLLFSAGKKIEKAIWIVDNWSEGYFHWLTDALPRLIATEKYTQNKRALILLPIEFEKYNYVKESLKLLNYECYFLTNKVLVKKLLLPSHTAPTGNYNKEIICALRDRISKKSNNLPQRNIFISRQKANRRSIINEGEVVDVLKLYGYEILFFEAYTFHEQVRLMSQTKSLISLHGAGLTNILFMPEHGQVLELRNRNDAHNNCYFSLASDLNHNYYYQLNDGNSDNTQIVDVTIDVDELKQNLERMKADNSTTSPSAI